MPIAVLSAIMQRVRLRLYPELDYFSPGTQRTVLRQIWGVYTAPSLPLWIVGLGSGLGFVLIRATLRPWMALPRWSAIVVVSLLVLIGTQVLRWYHLQPTRRRLREQLVRSGVPICIQCGYLLKGLSEPRCPECGREFDPKLLQVSGPC